MHKAETAVNQMNNHIDISAFLGLFFWVVLVVGIIVFVRSAFKTDNSEK